MKNNPARAVLWDMDGVVVDSAVAHRDSWKFAFGKQGVSFTDKDFEQVFGQRNDLIIRKIMGQDIGQSKIDEVAEDKEIFFRELIRKDMRAFPGVIKLLKLLKENGIKAAIGSSAPMENIKVILDGLGITGYFQALVYGQEVRESKPSPQVYQLAARKLGAEPQNCIVIEDAVAGVLAARRGGMHCIAVTNSHPAEALSQADLVVDSLEKVDFRVLEKVYGGEKDRL